MNRIRIEHSSFAALLAAVLLLGAAPARAQSDAERTEARAHFDAGVAFAKASAYEAALGEFERAYELVPHYGVLYNIAQAQLALGRTAPARASFERYLREAGNVISAARRAEVESLLARLPAEPSATSAEKRDFPAEPAEPPPAAPQSPATETQPRAEADPPATSTESAVPPAAAGARGPALARSTPPSNEDPQAPPSVARTLAYVLGGASIALAGGAVGHYFWNRNRYSDWQTTEHAYEQNPTEAQRVSLNELSSSIRRASVVTVALTIGASLTLGTSVVLFVSGQPIPSSRRGDSFESNVGVRGHF